MRQTRNRADPFFFYLQKYNSKDMQSYSFEEFLEVITTMEDANMPDYKKLALAIMNHPQKLREIMPTLVQNLKEGKSLFNATQVLASDEEVRSFYKNHGMFFANDKIKFLIETIENLLLEPMVKQLTVLEKKIENLSLVEFHKVKKSLKNEFPLFLLNFAYVKTHPKEEDDILQAFCIDTLARIAEEQTEIIDDLALEVEKYKKIEAEVEQLRKDTAGYADELAHKNEKYKASQKEVQQLSKKVTQLETTLQRTEKNLTEELEKKRKEAEKMKQEYEAKIKEAYKKQRNMEMLFQNQESEQYPDFAVVYTIGGEIFDMFFPEILAISIEEWEKQKKNIPKENIKKLYIQRDGISSSKYLNVVEFADKHQIEKHAFFASTPKKLLEIIGHLKYENGSVVYGNY
jgi:DNA repair exonuclease SbcCD ATPase subunit